MSIIDRIHMETWRSRFERPPRRRWPRIALAVLGLVLLALGLVIGVPARLE